MIGALAHRFLSPRLRKRLQSAAQLVGIERKFLRLRRPGFNLLSGEGLEIGAFEHPAPLPAGCDVRYADALTPTDAARLFPEIDATSLVPIDYVVDLDTQGLEQLPTASLDFVIACHVIEHVANPGRLVAEMLRVLRPGGKMVIAAPDRDFTFDRRRPLTPVETLERFFQQGRPTVGPEDYRDILTYVDASTTPPSEAEAILALQGFHARREHLSIWTAASFREFLLEAFAWSGIRMVPAYEVMSDQNQFEYFGVWLKQ